MFKRIYPLAPRIVKYNLLKSLSQSGSSHPKPQSSRQKPTLPVKQLTGPATYEASKLINSDFCFTNFNMTVCFSKKSDRIDHIISAAGDTNSNLSLIAANDTHRDD